MNIEELELSLRSEFEGQMGNVIARMRQEVSELQNRFDAEFQKQRELMDASFRRIKRSAGGRRRKYCEVRIFTAPIHIL